MDLHSGHIVGTEALIGWDKPETGLIAPDEFLPSCSFPIDKLKIDLISGIPANRDAVALTQAIIAMA